jgi:bacterioferritin
MKGSDKIIGKLNVLLTQELTSINQYVVHSTVNKVHGYKKLHKSIFKRATGEMSHAEDLIQRIVFLEGSPIVSRLNAVNIGNTVPDQLKFDLEAERTAAETYNEVIGLAREVGDNGTRELLEDILEDEERHILYIEGLLEQIGNMGLDNFLSTQI